MPSAFTIFIIVVPILLLLACVRIKRVDPKEKILQVEANREVPLWRRLTTHLLTIQGTNVSPAIWAAVVVGVIVLVIYR